MLVAFDSRRERETDERMEFFSLRLENSIVFCFGKKCGFDDLGVQKRTHRKVDGSVSMRRFLPPSFSHARGETKTKKTGSLAAESRASLSLSLGLERFLKFCPKEKLTFDPSLCLWLYRKKKDGHATQNRRHVTAAKGTDATPERLHIQPRREEARRENRRQIWRRYEESVAKSVSRRRRGVCRRGHSSRVFHVDANDDELSVRQRRDIRERVENVV